MTAIYVKKEELIMDDFELIGAMMAIGFFAFIAIFLTLIGYVISSLLLMKVFKMAGYNKPVHAWIPFYNAYILASILSEGLDSVHVLFVDIPRDLYKWCFLIIYAASLIISNIPFVGPFISLALSVIFYGDQNARVFALMSGKSVEDETAIGLISAFVYIVYIVMVVSHRTDGTERIRFRENDVISYRDVDNNGYNNSNSAQL